MENWKLEIKRLNTIREKIGLNWNQLEKLSGENRQKISRMFLMLNEPSLGFYLSIKSILESQIKIFEKDKKDIISKKIESKSESIIEEKICDCRMSGTLFIRGKGCTKSKEEHKF